MSEHNCFGVMSTHASLPCASCGDGVAVDTDYLTPVTLCGACTPEHWDGATLPEGAVEWAAILDHPCMPTRDHAGSYDALSGHLGNLELGPDAAAAHRRAIERAA